MAVSSNPRFSFSWSVDTTVGKVLSVSTDIIRTCTSDNVQPLAILACERFGAQLAICPETRLKVEQLARRKHAFYFFKHLEASIGFTPGDTADYFASSDAGGKITLLKIWQVNCLITVQLCSKVPWPSRRPLLSGLQLSSSKSTTLSPRSFLSWRSNAANDNPLEGPF